MKWIIAAFILGVPLFIIFVPLGALVFLVLLTVGMVKVIRRNGQQVAVVNPFTVPDSRVNSNSPDALLRDERGEIVGRLDVHTEAWLLSHGYNAADVERLRAIGAVDNT